MNEQFFARLETEAIARRERLLRAFADFDATIAEAKRGLEDLRIWHDSIKKMNDMLLAKKIDVILEQAPSTCKDCGSEVFGSDKRCATCRNFPGMIPVNSPKAIAARKAEGR